MQYSTLSPRPFLYILIAGILQKIDHYVRATRSYVSAQTGDLFPNEITPPTDPVDQ